MAKRKKITRIIIIVIAVILGLSVITTGAVKLSDDSKRIYPAYHIGSIDIETGEYVETDDAIYSDLFECQGLKVEANFSKGVNYSVFFYRFDESFVRAEVNKSDVYKVEDNDVIRFARIVITPDKGDKTAEEFKVKIFDIPKLTKNVKVTVYKEQEEIKDLGEIYQKGSWDDVLNTEWQRLAPINVSNIKQLAFVFEGGIDNVFDIFLRGP